MKLKHKILNKVLAVGLSAMTLLSTVTTAFGANTDEVTSGLSSNFGFTYNGSASFSGATLGNFTVTGVSDDKDSNATRQAFCIENSKSNPDRSTLNNLTSSDDARLAKALYYGWIADENNSVVKSVYGNNADNRTARIVTTSTTLSQLYSGQSYGNSGDAATIKSKLLAVANNSSYEIPNNKLSLSDSNLSVYVKNGKQVSETTQLKGYSGNSIKVIVPSGITLVNETQNKSTTNNTATIKVNDKFHLEASLDCSKSYDSGKITGSLYDFKVYIAKSNNSGIQDIATYCWAENKSSSIQFKANFTPKTTTFEIIKDSANYSLTDNNTDCYSLKGAVFTLTNTSTNKKYTVTTDTPVNDGSATVKYKGVIKDLPVGEYEVVETKAPQGYAIPNEYTSSNPKIITVSADNNSLTVKNNPQNDPISVLLRKNSDTGKAVQGAEFTIKFYKGYFTKEQIENGDADSSFKRYWTIKTDEYGYATLNSAYLVDSNNDFYYNVGDPNPILPLGTVTIQETKAPDGYIKDDTLYVQQITGVPGSSESVFTYNEFENVNEVNTYYELTKTSEDGVVSNVKINIYEGNTVNSNKFLKTVTTDKNGKIKEKLDVGTYTFDEVADSRYIKPAPVTITITSENTESNPAKINFENTLKTGWLKLYKTAEPIQNANGTTSPGKIEGIEFKVYDSNSKLVGTYITNSEGFLANDIELKPGTYTVEETPVAGYMTQPTRTVTIEAEKVTTVRFNNSQQGGVLKIKKTSDRASTETITFRIDGVSNNFHTEAQVKVGRSQSIMLPSSGVYKVTEILTDEQKLYWQDPEQESKTVTLAKNGETVEVEFNNHEKLGNIRIQKTATDGFIENVKFLISGKSYSGMSIYSELTTNADGVIEINDIPVGEYSLKEIGSHSPNYYTSLYEGTVTVNWNETTQVDVNNETYRKLKIIKTSDYGSVEGFTFRLTCEALNYSKEFTTDENGFITANKLKAGTYKIEEILPADSIYEQPKAQTITIEYPKTAKEFNTPYKVNFKNIPKDGYAKIIKTSESNNVEGFEFNLTGVDYLGNSVSYTALKTSEDGLIQQKIKPGTYTVEEINVPSYFEQPEAQSITVKANETATVEFYNQFVRGYGQVQKTSDDGKVEGLHFRLTGTADCGRIVNKDAYTNADGIAEFNRILVGTYTLEEIDTPEQYKPFEPVTVRIEEDKTTYVTAHNTFCDVPGKIIKTSEDGKIEGIEFRITNDALGYDKTFTTDANGVITTNLYPTTYKVTELNAADYYIPQATKELVVTPYNSESDIATVTFENLLKKGTVRVQKTADDNVIENVEFRIFGVSTAGITINMFAKTNVNGVAEFNNIPIGNYALFEINQPDRYIAVIEQDFDVTWDETTTMIVENNLKKGEIKTTAKDKDTDCGYAYVNESTTLIDTVTYQDLGTNTEYTVEGVLMDKETGEQLLVNGNPVTASKTFTTTATGSGEVDVEFNFNSTALRGKSVVVFEQLYYNGVELASHKDITDEGQTVTFKDPNVGTTAKDVLTDGHNTYVNEETTIVDTVEYNNLIVGKGYKLIGKLMDKSTGDIIKINNTDLVSEITFIPETENGTVDVSFTFDSTSLKGKDVVAFEYLYFNENEISTHTDINDEGQTITFRDITVETTAVDNDTETHAAYINEMTTITDTVAYTNLIIGKEYTVKGVLMNKTTSEPLEVNSEQVTAERIFTAESENGTINIEFTFDSSALQGEAVVAFEHLYYEDIEVASHTDLNDDDQTVEFKEPKIGTTAKDKTTGTHNAKANKTTTIIDTVTYENLVIGKEYTVKGTLMVKETGKALLVNGKEITAEKTFTTTSENGSVDIEFTFDSSALEGKSVVAFETIYFNDLEIATHCDINDDGQTVTFDTPDEIESSGTPDQTESTGKPDTTESTVPYTGSTVPYVLIILFISSAGVIMLNRKKENN